MLQKGHKVIIVTHSYSISPSASSFSASNVNTTNANIPTASSHSETNPIPTVQPSLESYAELPSTQPQKNTHSTADSLSPESIPLHTVGDTSEMPQVLISTFCFILLTTCNNWIDSLIHSEHLDSSPLPLSPATPLSSSTSSSFSDSETSGLRQGVRYMTNGLKVYYLPLAVCFDQVIFPTLYAFFPLFRNILIRSTFTKSAHSC